jgi:cytochrome c-type biogenesis protein CcmH/NrfG
MLVTISIIIALIVCIPFFIKFKAKYGLAVIVLLVAIPLTSELLYHKLGQGQYLTTTPDSPEVNAVRQQLLKDPAKIIAALQQQVQEQPSAQGYYLLGKLYIDSNDFKNGLSALQQAYQLDAKRSDIALGLFTAYFYTHQRFLPQYNFILYCKSQYY